MNVFKAMAKLNLCRNDLLLSKCVFINLRQPLRRKFVGDFSKYFILTDNACEDNSTGRELLPMYMHLYSFPYSEAYFLIFMMPGT